MATLAQVQGSVPRYIHTLSVQVVGQDTAANTTTLNYQYTVASQTAFSNGAWTTIHNVTFHAYINGADITATPNFDFRVNKNLTVMTGTVTIANASDGSLSVDLGLACNTLPGSPYFTAVSVSPGGPNSIVVPTIPRASTVAVTPNPVSSGDTVTVNITRASTSFTHDITWVSGASSGTIGTGVATSATWTPSSGLLGGLPRIAIAITVVTKNGSTVIGTTTYDLSMIAPPSYPSIGIGTPYDIRFKRVDFVTDHMVPKEVIPFLTATTTDTASASATCTIAVSSVVYPTDLEEAVVVADFYDGSGWLGINIPFVLTRKSGDTTDETGTNTYTGIAYADYLLSKNDTAQDLQWPTTSTGNILGQYIAVGQQRGWGPLITKTFTEFATSVGTPWQNTTTPNVSQGTPISQLLSGFVSDVLCEYGSHFDVTTGKVILDMWNPGYGSDWTSAGANPIINLSTAAMNKVTDKAPVRKDSSDKVSRVFVKGDEGVITRESILAVNPIFGHLEGSVSASGVKDATQLAVLGDAVLGQKASATLERTFSYDLSSTQTPSTLYPYRTFRSGDWILVPGDSGPTRARVSQVAITKNADTIAATITVGDMIPSGVAATARKLAQTSGGAISGGTLLSPAPLSAAIPSAPVGASTVSTGFWDASGAPKSGVVVTWSPIIASVAGSSILVDLYEVWTRPNVGANWVLATISSTPTATITPLDTSLTFDIEVRGRTPDGVYGVFSDPITVTTNSPTVSIAGPDLANLYTDGVGNLFAVWGGTVGGAATPLSVAYVVAEVSSDGGATYQQLGTTIAAAGSIVISPGAYGTFLVRLRAYDRLGNAGTASSATSITTSDPHITPPNPLAPTSVTATPGASWDATGFLPSAWFDLAWTAPTLDTLGASVVIAGYDIYGLRGGETVERYLTSSTANSVRYAVGNGEAWTFRVRAVSNFGGDSAYSTAVSATANATISAAASPTAPTLDQYAGLLRVLWAGGGIVPQIKYAYATISTSPTGTYTRAGMILNGAGEIDVPGLATGVTYYAKIVIVDALGQTSTSAASSGLLLNPITGITVQTSPVADTGIKMTSGALTAYDASGNPTFILNAATGEVWIAPYDAVFHLGAAGTVATTGAATTGISISSPSAPFNTFINPSGLQIRNNTTPLSWWEADAADASLVNFFSPRAVIDQRFRVGDYEMLKEAKPTGTRLVIRYKGL